jgi:uracil-DNA glycosylase
VGSVTARPLVVGEAPGPNTDPLRPLVGSSGEKLAKLVGVGLDRFLAPLDAVNLLDERPSGVWPKDAAAESAAALRAIAVEDGREVVLLGSRVAAAFGVVGPELLRWFDDEGLRVAVAPHPSGLSRWWNVSKNKEKARRFWRVLHREASRAQGQGLRKKRETPAVPAHQRPPVELDWLRDRVEDYYVQAMSVTTAVRALMQEHRAACEAGREVAHDGQRFVPERPVSRTQAYNLLADVRERWKANAVERADERRMQHHESIAQRVVEAKQAGAWPTVYQLHRLLAEVDGVVGRPEERAASMQVAVVQSGGQLDVFARMGDAELEALGREALGLPGPKAEPRTIDVVGSTSEPRGATRGPGRGR